MVSVYAEDGTRFREGGTNEELYEAILAHQAGHSRPVFALGDRNASRDEVQAFID